MRDAQVDALQIGEAQHGKERAALAVALAALQVEVPVGAAPHDPPRLLVGGRRRHAHALEHGRQRIVGGEREGLAEALVEEEGGGGQPAAARLPLADALGAVAGGVPERHDGRHDLVAGEAAHARREGPLGERAAQPAGAKAEAGGVEDGLLDEVAVVLEVFRGAPHGADQKARRPFDEAVRAEAPERLAVAWGGRHQGKARVRAERPERVCGEELRQFRPLGGRDRLVAVGTARVACVDELRDRSPEPAQIVSSIWCSRVSNHDS